MASINQTGAGIRLPNFCNLGVMLRSLLVTNLFVVAFAVVRTPSWDALGKGLPQDNAFMGIYREGMAMDSLNPAGIYFGTNTGKLFNSDNEGDSWRVLADNLPPIYSVSTAVI